MRQFRDTLNSCELMEIPLQNCKFTWSNERRNPTLVKLDRVFCNAEWDTIFSTHALHALATSLSDHCPLLLCNQCGPRRPKSFKFENFWAQLPGFKETVAEAWQERTDHYEPFHKFTSEAKILFLMTQQVILCLDVAQENRTLSSAELSLRAKLKKCILGLAVIERARSKQASRITNLKMGDANTKYFHRRINARRRKNFIQQLRKDHGWAISHEEKAATILEHFNKIMGRPLPRRHDLNWEELNLPTQDLSVLDAPFVEEEIKNAILQMPGDKAPRQDGFTGVFFFKMLGHHQSRLLERSQRLPPLKNPKPSHPKLG
ncbi:hypothetical protein BS78_10G160700 [Paspalum vaginatum]|nr:hypothetical protein BS78_10G160700 [Paspalum vaginatum]